MKTLMLLKWLLYVGLFVRITRTALRYPKMILLPLFLLLPLTVHAQDAPSLKVPMTVFAASAAADWSSTAYCVSSPYCHEANPMFAWAQPHGVPAMIALGASFDVATGLLFKRIGVHHPKLAAIGLYANAAARIAFATHNARLGYTLHQPCPLSNMFCRD